jgi:hypothetical protein
MDIYAKKLPIQLVYKILSYVHNPQPSELLKDIKNYYTTTNIILYYYEIKYMMLNQLEDPMDWLNNDVISFMNSYKPTMWGYVPNFYKILLRNPFINPLMRRKFYFYPLQNNTNIDNSDYTYKAFLYIHRLEKESSIRGFNILWGLLNSREREIFIRNTITDINYLYDLD